MSCEKYDVVDCERLIVESAPEMAEFMSTCTHQATRLKATRNRQGVFPSVDGRHFALHEERAQTKQRITANL